MGHISGFCSRYAVRQDDWCVADDASAVRLRDRSADGLDPCFSSRRPPARGHALSVTEMCPDLTGGAGARRNAGEIEGLALDRLGPPASSRMTCEPAPASRRGRFVCSLAEVRGDRPRYLAMDQAAGLASGSSDATALSTAPAAAAMLSSAPDTTAEASAFMLASAPDTAAEASAAMLAQFVSPAAATSASTAWHHIETIRSPDFLGHRPDRAKRPGVQELRSRVLRGRHHRLRCPRPWAVRRAVSCPRAKVAPLLRLHFRPRPGIPGASSPPRPSWGRRGTPARRR